MREDQKNLFLAMGLPEALMALPPGGRLLVRGSADAPALRWQLGGAAVAIMDSDVELAGPPLLLAYPVEIAGQVGQD